MYCIIINILTQCMIDKTSLSIQINQLSFYFMTANINSALALSPFGMATAPLRKTSAPLLLYMKLITTNSEGGKERGREGGGDTEGKRLID